MKTYGRSGGGEKRSASGSSVFVESSNKRRITDYFGVPETVAKAENRHNAPVPPGSGPAKTQLYLDVGQKGLLLHECRECKMRFDRAFPCEVRLHDRFHRFHTTGMQIKYEARDVIGRHKEFTAVSVAGRRREEIMELVSKELNAVDLGGDEHVFVLVDDKNRLCSVVITEAVEKGGYIAVSRIWTRQELRRRGLASILLQAIVDAKDTPKDRVIFSAPTDSGRQFAQAFTGQSRIVVYTDRVQPFVE